MARLHATFSGRAGAPVVVLVGSLGTTGEMWGPLLGPLGHDLRAVCVDLRGHGGSEVPPGPYSMADLGGDVLAFLDREGIDRAWFAGVSIGGMVGLWLAAHAGERLHGLVAMCTAARLEGGFDERARTVREAGGPEPLADAVVERWLTPGFAAEHADLRAWLRAQLASTPAEGYAGCCEAIAAMDLRGDLPSIDVPTLVVSGAQDPSIPPEHQRAIADAVPGARYELVDPAAHLAPVERPDAVARLLRDFVLG